MRRELAAVLDEIEADEAVRVVILTGAGGHFCSGGDVKTMRAKRHTAAEGRARVESLNRMVLRLVDFPKPTIAMVDGYAVGAGSNLALCCDLIVASDRAKFGELFWKIGLVPDGGGSWLLSRVVGLARAKELIFTAEIIDAAEAGRIGLVNRVVPAAELVTTTRGLAERIAPGPPKALAMAKHMVNRAASSELEGARGFEWGADHARRDDDQELGLVERAHFRAEEVAEYRNVLQERNAAILDRRPFTDEAAQDQRLVVHEDDGCLRLALDDPP